MLLARKMISEVKEKTGKDKIVVFPTSLAEAHNLKNDDENKEKQPDIIDTTGRSVELKNVWNIVRKLSQRIWRNGDEEPADFGKHISNKLLPSWEHT